MCRYLHLTFDQYFEGPSWLWSYGSWIFNYLCNRCLSPLMLWVRISIKARCTTLCDKVCQWLATGRWFSPGPLVSSTNKIDRHDITEILLKVALTTINLNQPVYIFFCSWLVNLWKYSLNWQVHKIGFPHTNPVCLREQSFHFKRGRGNVFCVQKL